MINNKSIKNILTYSMKYVLLTKVREGRNKKSRYKSPEWYEVLRYTTDSLQKQNTNQLNNENYVTA